MLSGGLPQGLDLSPVHLNDLAPNVSGVLVSEVLDGGIFLIDAGCLIFPITRSSSREDVWLIGFILFNASAA